MIDEQHGARGESHIRFVSTRLDRDFSTYSVGTADASDDDAHQRLALCDVKEIDTDTATVVQCGDNRAQRGCGTPGAADNSTHILRIHAHVKALAATLILLRDTDVLGMIDDPLHQMTQSLFEH
jgi:hypothetical protein